MVHYILPVPIGEYNLNNHPDLDKLLNNINLSEPNQKMSIIKGGNSSFPTRKNILNFPELKELKKTIQECIINYWDNLDLKFPLIGNSWFNVLKKEGKVFPHQHNGSVISGAFYPLLEENSCNLIFHSPLNTFFQSFLSMDEKESKITNNLFKVPIKQNFLYLFPSTLMHETEKNKSNKRIVVSFNTKYDLY